MRLGFQFRLSFLFALAAVGGLVCSIHVYREALYHADRIAIGKLLGQVNGIENVWLDPIVTESSKTEGIFSTAFSIKGRPDTLVKLKYLENVQNGNLAKVELTRIGDFQIWVCGEHGEESKLVGDWYSSGVEFAEDENFKPLIDLEIQSLQELVDRYDEVLAMVDTWPRMKVREKFFVDRQGRRMSYYAAERDDDPAIERNAEFTDKSLSDDD